MGDEDPPAGTGRSRRILWTVLKLACTAGLLYLVARRVDGARLSTVLSEADPLWLLAAFGILFVRIAFWGERFRFLLLVMGETVSRWFAACSYLVGNFASLGLPTLVGGDVVRGIWVFRKVRRGADLTGVVLFERITGLMVAFVLALIFMWTTPLLSGRDTLRLGLSVASITYLVGFAAAVLPWTRRLLDRLLGRLVPGRAGPALRGVLSRFGGMAEDPLVLGVTAAWSFLGQIASIGACVLAARAVGLALPPAQIIPAIPIVWLAGMFPVTLGGMGVREAAFVVLLAPLGAPEERCLALGLAMSALFVLQGLVGGVLFLAARNAQPQ